MTGCEPGPAGTQRRIRALMTRAWWPEAIAREAGVPVRTMAWDDESIDDPDGRPADGWKPSGARNQRSADLAEDAGFVREHGGYKRATNAQVAMRLGVTPSQLEAACARVRASGRAAQAQAASGVPPAGTVHACVPERAA